MPRACSKVRIYQEKYQRQDWLIGKGTMIPLRIALALHEVSVSGYYKWILSDKEHKKGVIHSDVEVLIADKDIIKESNNTVPGAVRVHHELDKKGFKVSHKRLVEIM